MARAERQSPSLSERPRGSDVMRSAVKRSSMSIAKWMRTRGDTARHGTARQDTNKDAAQVNQDSLLNGFIQEFECSAKQCSAAREARRGEAKMCHRGSAATRNSSEMKTMDPDVAFI